MLCDPNSSYYQNNVEACQQGRAPALWSYSCLHLYNSRSQAWKGSDPLLPGGEDAQPLPQCRGAALKTLDAHPWSSVHGEGDEVVTRSCAGQGTKGEWVLLGHLPHSHTYARDATMSLMLDAQIVPSPSPSVPSCRVWTRTLGWFYFPGRWLVL